MRAIVVVVVAALVVGGCSSTTSSTPASPPTKVDACPAARAIDDPDLAAFAAGLQLPAGARVVTGRVSKQSNKPGLVGVALDLCVPGSDSADALRPTATEIAKALKATPLGERTFALFVADLDASGSEVKVKDPDYQSHLWNGKPSVDAELARWQVVGN